MGLELAGLCSMAYTPLKIAYAGSGLVFGTDRGEVTVRFEHRA